MDAHRLVEVPLSEPTMTFFSNLCELYLVNPE